MYALDQETKFSKLGEKMEEMEKDAGNSGENIKMRERVGEMWTDLLLTVFHVSGSVQKHLHRQ